MKFSNISLKIQPSNLRHKWGESFRMEFDEAFGILYCDLKLIAGACGCGSIPQETERMVSNIESPETRAGDKHKHSYLQDYSPTTPACQQSSSTEQLQSAEVTHTSESKEATLPKLGTPDTSYQCLIAQRLELHDRVISMVVGDEGSIPSLGVPASLNLQLFLLDMSAGTLLIPPLLTPCAHDIHRRIV